MSTELIASIKAARLQHKLTQEQLARRANIPLRTYQRLEGEYPGTKLDTLTKVLDALGLSMRTTPKRRPTLSQLNDLYGDE